MTDLFSWAESRDDRDKSIAQVEESRCTDADRFESAVRLVARVRQTFTTDDVLKSDPSLESITEKRVFGAVLLRLSRSGMIEPVGYVQSDRRTSHARPKRLWRTTR